jgi:hypothetical protein
MTVSARPYLTAGVAALAAGMIAAPTSIAPPAPSPAVVHDARIALAASTGPAPAPLGLPAAFVVVPGQPAAAPTAAVAASPKVKAAVSPKVAAAAPSALVAFPGVADAIINGYNAVLPYVNYGVNLAQYAVGWIPVAGIFAPQIGIFYYNLIEPIVTSAVYNTAYVIGGDIGFIQAVSNVINDSVAAGTGFVNAEINWALSFLPPLPPLPPLSLAATQTTTLKTALVAGEPAGQPVAESATAEKPDTNVAGSVEATTKEAPVAEKAPKPSDPASTETVKGEAAALQEPITTKPETVPEPKPTTTTTTSSSSGGVAAQGEVRGGTTSAADPKAAEASKDGEPSGQKPGKPSDSTTEKSADKSAEKPAESGAGADAKAGAKGSDGGKGSTGSDGAKKDTPKKG